MVEDCTQALLLNPKYLKALHRRAKGFEHTKRLDLCLEDITAACILGMILINLKTFKNLIKTLTYFRGIPKQYQFSFGRSNIERIGQTPCIRIDVKEEACRAIPQFCQKLFQIIFARPHQYAFGRRTKRDTQFQRSHETF